MKLQYNIVNKANFYKKNCVNWEFRKSTDTQSALGNRGHFS